MHPEFPPIAFIAACSVLFVIPWHWRAGNVATLSIAFWLFITNVIYGVDAVIWGNNVRIVVPVWCDITTKFLIGANVALPAASLCVCIHLEQVASIRRVQSTFSDKRRRQIIELIVCFGLPTLIMALHYIVQGHRFDIIEEYGCRPTTYFSVLAIFIQYIPPLVLSAASMVYSALALRHFMLRRISFAAHLQNSNSALTTSRYLRLMLMAVVQMLWSAIVTSYTLWFTTISIPIRSWTNWADVHSDWLRIDLYSTLFTPPIVIETYYILWWTIPASTIIFVGFFAFGRDALDEYKKCFAWFRTRVLRRGAGSKPAKGFVKVFTVRYDVFNLIPVRSLTSTLTALPPNKHPRL
ncbi:fungal pheromone STE3G-protein-coupled receptor [Tricholoma matsutake]|nr:fungal pheromone STE3G-protein-coupled receptor [Tricholoma matsutake 945]